MPNKIKPEKYIEQFFYTFIDIKEMNNKLLEIKNKCITIKNEIIYLHIRIEMHTYV